MCSAPRDVAQIRLDNAMRLFDEFVAATIKHPDAAALRGLERRFAERLQIQPSYWSQIKSRSRQIGERLARQFEQLSHKPNGWMDQEHGGLTYEQTVQLSVSARANGFDTFVRMAPSGYELVTQNLEAGASGVLAAQIFSAEQAEQFVRWTKFAPRGSRGLRSGVSGRSPSARTSRRASGPRPRGPCRRPRRGAAPALRGRSGAPGNGTGWGRAARRAPLRPRP